MFLMCLSAWRDARASLADSPRELWLALGPLRLLAAAPYYTLSSIFVGFVERAFRFTDRTAPLSFGLWGAANTLATFIGGWICDAIGVRRTLITGAVFSCLGFSTLAIVRSADTPFWVAMYVLIPVGIGLGLPVCDVANRRFSTPSNEQIVYPLAYAVSTLGQCVGMAMLAAISAAYIDTSRRHGKTTAELENDTQAERYVFIFCAWSAALCGVVAWRYMKDVHVTDRGDIEVEVRATWSWRAGCAQIRTRLSSLWHNKMFARVALMVLFTLPARHVFILLYTTLSIYLRRTLGVDAPTYAFMLIDPALEMVLAPLFAIFLPQFDIYYMIIIGATISSLGLLGFLLVEASYVSIALTLTMFAIGSAMYVPRVQQYVLVLAPDGEEGQFAALASTLPILIGKIVVGLTFGSLLDKDCPDHQLAATDHCALLWMPSVIVSFLTPLCLLIFMRFIHTDDVRAHFAKRLASIRSLHLAGSEARRLASVRMVHLV